MPIKARQFRNPDDLFFTADLHFGHSAMALDWRSAYRFSNTNDMDNYIISNWNDLVPQSATTIIVGDLSFYNAKTTATLLAQLSGQLIVVRGNHDKGLADGFFKNLNIPIYDYLEIDVHTPKGKQRVVLSHFAFRTWNRHHYGAWHLHGHSHGNLPPLGKSMDVGVDTKPGLRPWSFNEVKSIMDAREIHTNDHHIQKQ